jgi:hypothetical protein
MLFDTSKKFFYFLHRCPNRPETALDKDFAGFCYLVFNSLFSINRLKLLVVAGSVTRALKFKPHKGLREIYNCFCIHKIINILLHTQFTTFITVLNEIN